MNSGRTILVVDEDSMLSEMLETIIELHNPAFETLLAESPEEAMAVFDRHAIDFVITEIQFANSAYGTEFAMALADRTPPVPFVVLTGVPMHEIPRSIKPRYILAKPPAMDDLLRRIDQAVFSNSDSILKGLRLETFLQVLNQERKTCVLTVCFGEQCGYLWVQIGELVHAVFEDQHGVEAAFAILAWPDYTVKVTETEILVPERTIQERMPDLLLQWAVHRDECAA
jgi:CheY-like chemotaxis protein